MKKLIIILCLLMITKLSANEVIQMLDERMKSVDSLVCVGLDPDLNKMPLALTKLKIPPEKKVYLFLTKVVDITAPHVCSFKIQKAFFDRFSQGHRLLKKLCHYIHCNYPGIPVFIDCKIGDIDNTMEAYMDLIFKDYHADGVVVNPYMGDDVLEPFLKDANKTAIVLIQTSNPSAKIVQELKLENGRKLWEEILHLTLKRWNKNKNLILVLSSNTSHVDYALLRDQIPQGVPILLAGIGAQGGNPERLKKLLDDNKRGVFVNSSRGILYPYETVTVEWENAVLKAVLALKNEINEIRN
jgi:orotidine-5'-phosphate decarboxylase